MRTLILIRPTLKHGIVHEDANCTVFAVHAAHDADSDALIGQLFDDIVVLPEVIIGIGTETVVKEILVMCLGQYGRVTRLG